MTDLPIKLGATSSRGKSSLLAWAFFAIVTAFALYDAATILTNRPAGDNLLNLIADLFWSLLAVEFAFLAALIVSRLPGNSIGRLMTVLATMSALDVLSRTYLAQFPTAPAEPTLPLFLAAYFSQTSWFLFLYLILFIILLFPDGRPPSPRWRWLLRFGLLMFFVNGIGSFFAPNFTFPQLGDWTLVNPIGFIPDDNSIVNAAWSLMMVVFILFCAAAPFVRYRRATGVQREQIKWLFYSCGLFAVAFIPWLFLWDGEMLLTDIIGVFSILAVMTIPAAIAIAILRYRLYDIDLIIRKTLLYGALTGLLALIFFGSVVLLQGLFQTITGQDTPITVVISTLLIAALFTPLRRRLQRAIDRRFFRQKYDAQRVLAQFAETARDEVELETLTAELARVTRETVQPESLTIWLRERRS